MGLSLLLQPWVESKEISRILAGGVLCARQINFHTKHILVVSFPQVGPVAGCFRPAPWPQLINLLLMQSASPGVSWGAMGQWAHLNNSNTLARQAATSHLTALTCMGCEVSYEDCWHVYWLDEVKGRRQIIRHLWTFSRICWANGYRTLVFCWNEHKHNNCFNYIAALILFLITEGIHCFQNSGIIFPIYLNTFCHLSTRVFRLI